MAERTVSTVGRPPDVEFHERALYLSGPDALVVADLHVGRAASAAVEAPLGEREDLLTRLDALLERFTPAELVVAGDLLHAFETVPRGVPETIDELETIVTRSGASLTVTPGNHDGLLETVTDVATAPSYRCGETVVCHGHESPAADAERYVIGHEHPAISIEGQRHPCGLLGPGPDDATLFVLPAFSRLATGTTVNSSRSNDLLSAMLENLRAFRPVVSTTDEALWFPPLSELRPRL